MIKLINENIDEIDIYVDMLPYEETLESVSEDMIQPDEEIKDGSAYFDEIDTRKFLKMYLKNDVVPTIKTYPTVKSCWVRNASEDTKTGLSNYVDLIFKHPENVTKDEIESFYTYTIRFSDHKHGDAEMLPNVIKSVDVIGMKPKNFVKTARSVFNRYRQKAQNRITEFEKEKFGKKVTVI